MESPPEDYPITGLCVVSDPTKCPPGYEVIYRSFDKGDDCDLWKDSIFRSKVTRYLCFTRVFPLEGGRLNNVLSDVCLNMDKEPPPSGFSLIDLTVDSREKATRKKQICVRMLPRNTTNDAISQLIILSRSKRPPAGYTLIGEMNGLIMCFKMNAVPPETKDAVEEDVVINNTPPPPYNFDAYHWPVPNRSYVVSSAEPMNSQPYPLQPVANSVANHAAPSTLNRADSIIAPTSVLSGVSFQLNPKLTDIQNLKNLHVPEISYRSLNDINNEYDYNFSTERTACAYYTSQSSTEY